MDLIDNDQENEEKFDECSKSYSRCHLINKSQKDSSYSSINSNDNTASNNSNNNNNNNKEQIFNRIRFEHLKNNYNNIPSFNNIPQEIEIIEMESQKKEIIINPFEDNDNNDPIISTISNEDIINTKKNENNENINSTQENINNINNSNNNYTNTNNNVNTNTNIYINTNNNNNNNNNNQYKKIEPNVDLKNPFEDSNGSEELESEEQQNTIIDNNNNLTNTSTNDDDNNIEIKINVVDVESIENGKIQQIQIYDNNKVDKSDNNNIETTDYLENNENLNKNTNNTININNSIIEDSENTTNVSSKRNGNPNQNLIKSLKFNMSELPIKGTKTMAKEEKNEGDDKERKYLKSVGVPENSNPTNNKNNMNNSNNNSNVTLYNNYSSKYNIYSESSSSITIAFDTSQEDTLTIYLFSNIYYIIILYFMVFVSISTMFFSLGTTEWMSIYVNITQPEWTTYVNPNTSIPQNYIEI